MIDKILLATRNAKKRVEIESLLADLSVRVLTLDDFPTAPEVVEDGQTFAENAIKKAVSAAKASGLVAVADDSGLEVDALGGAPGVRSARYAGPGATDADLVAKLLREMASAPPERRTARFRCAIACADPDGPLFVVEGRCEGSIALRPEGANGFGYDPVFVEPESGLTFAQMSMEAKNRVSHRGRALARFRRVFEALSLIHI